MTNVFGKPAKLTNRRRLFDIGVEALQQAGWKVEREDGRSSVCKISRNGKAKTISLITTQDQWISYKPLEDGAKWLTLSDVDDVVAVSVDDREAPRNANVHYFSGKEILDRFNRAYKARKAAGHIMPEDRGIWVGLYVEDANEPTSHVGAGAGLTSPPIAVVPLDGDGPAPKTIGPASDDEDGHLTIAEAKRRLAKTFGVSPENIKIFVEA